MTNKHPLAVNKEVSPELRQWLDQQQEQEKQKNQEIVASIPKPDYNNVALKEWWTTDEFTAYSLDTCPARIKRLKQERYAHSIPFIQHYDTRHDLIFRAAIKCKFYHPIHLEPLLCVEWANKGNMELSAELSKLVKKYHSQPDSTDWKAECQKCNAIINEQKTKIAKLESLLKEKTSEGRGKTKSLNKATGVIASIAKEKFKYGSDNFDMSMMISSINRGGGAVDDQTLSTYLKEGTTNNLKSAK
jgi:hypothetical protein